MDDMTSCVLDGVLEYRTLAIPVDDSGGENLAKRRTLPPGLAKRELPLDLRRRLPRRYHADLYNIDGNAVLIQRGTELVLDMIEGIFAEH